MFSPKKISTACAIAVLFLSPLAHAQWLYQKSGGAFEEHPTHTILAVNDEGYGFGFQCKDAQTLTVAFATTERTSGDTIETLNRLDNMLYIRVDDNPIIKLDTELTIQSSAEMGAESSISVSAIHELIKAKTKVSVAIKIHSEILHEQAFSISGAADKGTKLIEGCGLDAGGLKVEPSAQAT